jgi:asparagine synthase (glutamine-hydrolysing)
MCGIAGLVSAVPIPGIGDRLARLGAGLAHRGPDDAGFMTWRDEAPLAPGRATRDLPPGRVGLVHRRLSIIDLAPTGWQPMCDADGRRALVFNGEIYDYRELRADPALAGHAWRGGSDTEVLAALLARQGLSALQRLTGMFAFAWLDLPARRLVLARDPFGIKPLHYAWRDGVFAFASELTPLLEIGAARRVVDRRALYRYLRHAVTNAGGETLFADIREVPPGHALEVPLDDPGAFRLLPFWTPPVEGTWRGGAGEAAEALRALFLRSVDLHMRADVPVVATLSGGIDSSGIVAAMRHLSGARDRPVFTFSAPGAATDERPWAEIMAGKADADLRVVDPPGEELAGELDALIAIQEQPFQTTSIWAQARVFRAVRDAGFKVVLDGQGADELFAGYPVFRAARLRALLRRGRVGAALGLLRASGPGGATLLLQALGQGVPPALRAAARRAVGRPFLPDWLDARYFAGHAVPPEIEIDAPPLRRDLVEALSLTSLPMLLRYADRNAMAVSLENRTPYLTADLARFALALPDALLIADDGTTKSLLRQALRGLVPDTILDRRDKIGFATPQAEWFARSPALRALVADSVAGAPPPCLAPPAIARLGAIAAGSAAMTAADWRCMNVVRWARMMRVELAS